MSATPRMSPFLLSTMFLAAAALANHDTDIGRLGTTYTPLTLHRGASTNVLRVGVGSPPVEVDLTLTTNVDYVMVATVDCGHCLDDATAYDSSMSNSFDSSQTAVQYTSVFPIGSADTLRLSGELVTEMLADDRNDLNTRPITAVTSLRRDASTPATNAGLDTIFPSGTSGFWGLGISQDARKWSIVPDMITRTSDGAPSSATNFTIGFDVANFSRTAEDPAGTIHWGGVPTDSYIGEFNWLHVNTSIGGSWGFDIDRLRFGGTVADLSSYYGTIDPGFDLIFVPTNVAEQLYKSVPGALRDKADATRWNLPCDTNISSTISIGSQTYAISSEALVQARDIAGRTCWGSVIAWQNGSVPEQLGEVRLGTPFLSGVYAALYYSDSEQFVGLAGKPNSVNAFNVFHEGAGHPNTKLAGILIGTLLGVLVLLFVICYARNRSSFQSIWYRDIRRQHRFQTNAMIRGTTLPPPGFIPPVVIPMPPPVPPPMMPMGGYAPVPTRMPYPAAPGTFAAPPPYRPPMPLPQQQPTNGTNEFGQMPHVVEPAVKGTYSPRQHASSSNFMPTAVPLPMAQKAHNEGAYDPDIPPSPPGSSKGGVRFGPVWARQPRSKTSAASSVSDRVPVLGPGANRDSRHAAWLARFSGVAPSEGRYHISGADPIPQVPPTSMSGLRGQGEKRGWGVPVRGRKGNQRSDVGYSPIMGYTAKAEQPHNSWFGVRGTRSSAGDAMGDTMGGGLGTFKLAERGRERESLSRAGYM